MIAFGCAISEVEPYWDFAEPGIRRAADPSSEVFAFAGVGAVGRSYNLVLDAAATHDDLEALVLVPPEVEILDPALGPKVREALRDPDVAIVGCAGATGVRTVAWWEGSITAADVSLCYGEHGGGCLKHYSWTDVSAPPGEVEVVAGVLLVLSPWAVRNLRFDEALTMSHGYDLDLCLQARAAGRRVVVADIPVAVHESLELVGNLDLWAAAHAAFAEKWDAHLADADPNGEEWQLRARRAEAEREAVRVVATSHALRIDARVAELEREMEAATSSLSWRLTAPLRAANRARARLGTAAGRSSSTAGRAE